MSSATPLEDAFAIEQARNSQAAANEYTALMNAGTSKAPSLQSPSMLDIASLITTGAKTATGGSNKIVNTAAGAVSGAAAGTVVAPGIGTEIGAIIGAVSSFFGGADASKKLANFKNDQNINTQHAVDFFQQISNPNDTRFTYTKYLSSAEFDALSSVLIPKVTENPYYGGLGTSYTSKYGGQTWDTVPGVGIAQALDKYIEAKNTAANTASSATTPGTPQTLATGQNPLSINLTGLTSGSNITYIIIGIVAVVAIAMFLKSK
jgi:hypothetical protein